MHIFFGNKSWHSLLCIILHQEENKCLKYFKDAGTIPSSKTTHTVKTDTTEGAVSSLKDMQTLQIIIGTGNKNDVEIQP